LVFLSLYIVHEVYKTFEDNDFDPNNFNKLIRDIKGITIELKEKDLEYYHLNKKEIGFDNYDFY
jgi:hypothetical protein